VYQKKLADEGKFSIKLIVKIPKEVIPKDFKKPEQTFYVNSVVSMERHNHLEPN